MEGKDYKFKFSCKDFELEVCGDQKFVERTLARFENKVMVKLRELLPHTGSSTEAPRAAADQSSVSVPKRPHETSPEKKSDHRRRRGRRSRKKHHHAPERPGEKSKGKTSGTQPAAREAGKTLTKAHSPSANSKDLKGKRPVVRLDEKALQTEVERKKPRTHHDRIMLFGNYLETGARDPKFSAEELKRCYKLLNEVPPVNIQQVLNHATRSGFLTRSQQGKIPLYRLSAKARKYVADGLRLI